MTNRDFRLYISGGTHVEWDPQERLDKIHSELGPNVDVVFNEAPRSNTPSPREQYKNIVGLPLMIAVFAVYFASLNLAAKMGRSDQTIVTELSQSADIAPVDRNYHYLLAQDRLMWSLGHYGILFMILFGFSNWFEQFNQLVDSVMTPLGINLVPVVTILTGLLIWFGAGGLLIGLFFITGTMTTRNDRIIKDIESYVEHNPEVEDGCLIVGGNHVEELQRLADRSEVITLVD